MDVFLRTAALGTIPVFSLSGINAKPHHLARAFLADAHVCRLKHILGRVGQFLQDGQQAVGIPAQCGHRIRCDRRDMLRKVAPAP
jgi:hypothetical protein